VVRTLANSHRTEELKHREMREEGGRAAGERKRSAERWGERGGGKRKWRY